MDTFNIFSANESKRVWEEGEGADEKVEARHQQEQLQNHQQHALQSGVPYIIFSASFQDEFQFRLCCKFATLHKLLKLCFDFSVHICKYFEKMKKLTEIIQTCNCWVIGKLSTNIVKISFLSGIETHVPNWTQSWPFIH